MPGTANPALSIMTVTGHAIEGAMRAHVGKPITASIAGRWSAVMLDRAVSLYQGVWVLVQGGLIEEAMVLGRPLFEESLMLQWLVARDEDERAAYVTWFDHDSWNRYALALRQIRPEDVAGTPDELDALIRHAEGRRDIASAFATRHGLPRRSFPTPNDIARDHVGRSRESIHFALSQQFVHGRALPISNRQDYDENGTMLIAARADSHGSLLPLVAYWSSSSILFSYEATGKLLGWPPESWLATVRSQVETLC